MLTDFEGMIDAQGLCTLRQCRQSRGRSRISPEKSGKIRFWAVIESECATAIIRELNSGSRTTAYRLLEELAVSLGTQCR
jgi:hypothetical protein